MNKKGFTLVELLAVIAILAIVTGLAMFSINNAYKNSREKILEDYISNIENSAINYVQNTNNILNSTDCSRINNKKSTDYDRCKVFTVAELLNLGQLTTDEKDGKIYNKVTNLDMMADEVTVYRENNRLHAEMTCMKSNHENC